MRENLFGLFPHCLLVLVRSGLEEDVARRDLFAGLEARGVLLIVTLDLPIAHADRGREELRSESDEAHLALHRPLEFLRVRVEPAPCFLIRHLDLRFELGLGDEGILEAELFVPPAVLVLEIGIRDHHPVGHQILQLLAHEVLAHLPLELRGGERPLREEAQIGVATDELSFALKRGKRDDEVRDLLIGDRKTLTLGLEEQDLVLHELAEDEVVEAELAHEVGRVLGAELLPVLLFLRSIAPEELLRRDRRAFDPGHFSAAGRTRRIEEVGNIEGDEG